MGLPFSNTWALWCQEGKWLLARTVQFRRDMLTVMLTAVATATGLLVVAAPAEMNGAAALGVSSGCCCLIRNTELRQEADRETRDKDDMTQSEYMNYYYVY
jgi:hypothetical protein